VVLQELVAGIEVLLPVRTLDERKTEASSAANPHGHGVKSRDRP
jgi:hypothetical protein